MADRLTALFDRVARILRPDPEPAPEPTLPELREEIEIAAQQILDRIDDALTAWQSLEQRMARERRALELWEAKAQRAQKETAARGSTDADRAVWENLAKSAATEMLARQDRVRILQEIMDQTRPMVEEALRLIDDAGLSRDRALSQVDRLEVTQATAEAKHRLASAQLRGDAARLDDLLQAAGRRVQELSATADAEEELARSLGR